MARVRPQGDARTPDGKLNLDAPPPRLPNGKIDFSGTWESRVPPGGPAGPGAAESESGHGSSSRKIFQRRAGLRGGIAIHAVGSRA